MEIIHALATEKLPLYRAPLPVFADVRLPRYEGPYASPVRHLTPDEYFQAKEAEKAQTLAKVLPKE